VVPPQDLLSYYYWVYSFPENPKCKIAVPLDTLERVRERKKAVASGRWLIDFQRKCVGVYSNQLKEKCGYSASMKRGETSKFNAILQQQEEKKNKHQKT
jgi:hypothetical protein